MMKAFILHLCLFGMAQALSTHVLPFAKEENKKRQLLHRHLKECECNNNGGGRNLAEAAKTMFERGLSDKSVQELIDGLTLTIRSDSSGVEEEVVTVTDTDTDTEPSAVITQNEQALALRVSSILEDAVFDLEELSVYTATYKSANEVVNQDATGIINAIFDFITDLIDLVISVIEQIVSLIVGVSIDSYVFEEHLTYAGNADSQIIVGIINIIVGVIVAIFQFIERVIRAIINFILGIFNADIDANNFLQGGKAYPQEAEEIPALQAIYDGLILGTQVIGLGDILQLVSQGGEALNGVLGSGLTTAPLVMMEFIGVNTTNSILCALGATETTSGCVDDILYGVVLRHFTHNHLRRFVRIQSVPDRDHES